MPATTRRPRTWSIVVTLVAGMLAVAVCGPPASARQLATSSRTVVTAGTPGLAEASRAPELRPATIVDGTPQHLGLAAPSPRVAQPPVTRPAPRAAHRLTPLTPVSDAAPRGRAPPAA
ncbi:hypothetical protein [Aeromicrobium sp. CF3.5]|uniref:hypothetical protein n=1 Tax=Aeromicrobium sp. CF3.5 TaxID=3373078 RepID=UPI003EE79511